MARLDDLRSLAEIADVLLRIGLTVAEWREKRRQERAQAKPRKRRKRRQRHLDS